MGDAPGYRIIPPTAFGVPLVAGLALTWWAGDPLVFSPWSRPAALVLVAIVAAWDAWTFWLMLSPRTGILPGQSATHLITRGPFAVSRNPLYLGLAGLHFATALWFHSTWAMALLPVAVLAVIWGSILPEERYLRKKFPDAYAEYAKRVHRWL